MEMSNCELQCAVRRRLGIAVRYEGEDTHGHASLTHNTGALYNIRHDAVKAAWRQVLVEAGGHVPQRNVERLLSRSNIPIDPADTRRLDLIATGLNVQRGLPLFCDVTVVTPLTRTGAPRPGTSNVGGRLLEQCRDDNDAVYQEVMSSGLGSLQCLGVEVFGRWGGTVRAVGSRIGARSESWS